jgi:hypothetical protein
MSEIFLRLTDIETQLKSINATLQALNDKVDSLSIKVEEKDTMEEEVLEECRKMGSHIDFVETVYHNVKHPLGFLCNKIKYLAGTTHYTNTLTDISGGKLKT